MQALTAIEVETGPNPGGSVIWLHGLGADGHDFEPIVPELSLSEDLPLRFVFPHAPVRPVTINNGISMRAWYDIYSLERSGPQDEGGVRESSDLMLQLVEKEMQRGVPANRIVLAGFSQGGAIAIHTALRHKDSLAGLLALSTYMPLQSFFDDEVRNADTSQNRSLPIFMAHGTFDPVVPMHLGRVSAEKIASAGFDVAWREYEMAHAVCAQEIGDISAWLESVLSA